MQAKDLQAEISSLEFQILFHEKKLNEAFGENIELRETKKIYQQLKLLKERMSAISEHQKLKSSPN